jgi:6-phosphogluconolactonase
MRTCWWIGCLAACGGSTAPAPDGGGGPDAPPPPARLVAYVSGGADIAWYDVDLATGALAPAGSIAAFQTGANFLAVHGTALYAVTSGDRVGAYAIDAATGALTFRNDVSTGGSGPAHVSVDATGGTVFVANYNQGNVSVFPVGGDGALGDATQTLASGANAHLIAADPSNHFVFVPCLGADHVAQYLFDASARSLTANAVAALPTANGAGPRHLAFAPDGVHAYLIDETDSTLSALALDGATGRLAMLQTVTTRAAGASGNNTTAEVLVHPSGKFVYGSNRGDDNIVVFAIDAASGMVSLVDHTSTQGMTPRSFAIDPTGTFLYAANQNSGTVVPFAIDAATGTLTPTAAPITTDTPQFVGVFPF